MRFVPALLALTLIAATSGLVQAQPQDAAAPLGDERVIIFFAWDQPVIDGDAAARLDALAASFARSPGVKLELAGHADRSGPPAPNMRSGRKRAEAVQAYLAARGVPGTAMTIVSHGESQPLIPTADGVREPQNRRVEIAVTRAPGG
ncbi:MAG: OmpA family protein [Sphingomonas bacterium]|nr:OmpA family protein [Sphingomonas bacterium]